MDRGGFEPPISSMPRRHPSGLDYRPVAPLLGELAIMAFPRDYSILETPLRIVHVVDGLTHEIPFTKPW